MNLGEINGILAGIQNDLKAIDLTKEKDIKKIEEMKKPTTEIDNAVARDDFKEEHLDFTLDMFKEASDRVGAYDFQQERDEAKKATAAQKKDITARITAKQDVQKSVKGKYDELSRKKDVIAKYKGTYKTEEFVNRQNRRKKALEDEIAINNGKLQDLEGFSQSVKVPVKEIEDNKTLIEELKKLSKLEAAVKTLKSELARMKKDGDHQMLIDDQQKEVDTAETSLNNKVAEVSGKHKGIKLNIKTLSADISAAEKTAKNNIKNAKQTVKNTAKISDKEFIKNTIHSRLDAAKTDEEFLSVVRNARVELTSSNEQLSNTRDEIEDNVKTLEFGETVRTAPTTGGPAPITESEIRAKIQSDSTIQTLAPVLSDEEKTEKFYSAIKGGLFKNSESPILHPIAFFRSKFDKKGKENWHADYEKEMIEAARKAIEEERRAQGDARKAASDKATEKESQYDRAMFLRIMRADSAKVTQMGEDIENNNAGKHIAETYEDIDQEH
jgi:hypothetical protein